VNAGLKTNGSQWLKWEYEPQGDGKTLSQAKVRTASFASLVSFASLTLLNAHAT
jgi:hypothetical protein